MGICRNNPERSSITKKYKHTPSGYSMFAHCSFDAAKNQCKDLKEHATKIINYEKKEMIPLTYKENKSYEKKKDCCTCKKGFSTGDDNKKYHKVREHCHYTGEYRGAENINSSNVLWWFYIWLSLHNQKAW